MKGKLIIIICLLSTIQVYGQKLIEESYQHKNNKKYVDKEKAFYHNQRFLNPDSTYTDKRFYVKTGEQIYENNYCSINPLIKHGIQIGYNSGKPNQTVYFNI